MCLRALEIGVSHSIGPFETLGEEVAELVIFRAGGFFEVTETLVCVVAVAMLNGGGNVVIIRELDEVFAEFSSRGEMGFAVLPMPVENVVETFGEFEFAPGDMEEIIPELSIGGHGLNDCVQAVVSMKIGEKVVGEASGVVHKGVVGLPVEIELEGTAEADTVGMFVHEV